MLPTSSRSDDKTKWVLRNWRTLFVLSAVIICSLVLYMMKENVELSESENGESSHEYSYVDPANIDYSSFDAMRKYPHSSNLDFVKTATPAFNYSDDKIPLINVFNRAGTNFLERFVRSIDYPTDTLMIVQDSLEDTRLLSLIRALRNDPSVRQYIGNIRHVVNINNTGCAQAWNTVIRLYPGEPFYIYSANDILLPPGGLKTFYNIVRQSQKEDPNLGLLSTHTYYGIRKKGMKSEKIIKTQFNAMFWAYTRQGVLRAGLYDENFFPGYYEDDEIIFRNFVSGMSSKCMPEVMVTHGYPSGYYRTGTMLEDRKNLFANEVKRSTNKAYMETKWGPAVDFGLRNRAKAMYEAGLETFQKYCGRNSADVPPQYRGFYCRPFNQSVYEVQDWPFHPKLRACIKDGAEGNTCKKYLPDFLKEPMSLKSFD
jgi:hypothetical protein